MKLKNNINNLKKFRLLIESSRYKESENIKHILEWRNKLKKKNRIKSKLINVKQVRNWFPDNSGNINHKSKQFFSLRGVRTIGAFNREVKSWDQPILTQKHGGILAFLSRKTNNEGVQFLLNAKTEPGDNGDIKLCPSFQATQSNINRAHGGLIPPLSNIVLKRKGAKLIYSTSHNEEGARFWKKTNINMILMLDDPDNIETKKNNYIWANLSQIKKLSLKRNIVNPFVKTILFMI